MSLRRALTAAEVLQGLFVLVVPLAALFGVLSVWVVLATLPLAALGKLFADPAQQAALPRAVKDDQLVRANSLFSVTRRAVDAVGRGVANDDGERTEVFSHEPSTPRGSICNQ